MIHTRVSLELTYERRVRIATPDVALTGRPGEGISNPCILVSANKRQPLEVCATLLHFLFQQPLQDPLIVDGLGGDHHDAPTDRHLERIRYGPIRRLTARRSTL